MVGITTPQTLKIEGHIKKKKVTDMNIKKKVSRNIKRKGYSPIANPIERINESDHIL